MFVLNRINILGIYCINVNKFFYTHDQCLSILNKFYETKAHFIIIVINAHACNILYTHVDKLLYFQTTELKGITIIGFQAPLYFANSSFFVREVQRLAGANPEQLRKQKPQEQDLTTRTPSMLTCTISTADLIGNSSCHDIPTIIRNSFSSSSSRNHNYNISLSNCTSNEDVVSYRSR